MASERLPTWLVRAVVVGASTILLSSSAWGVRTIIADGNRITAVETQSEDVVKRLDRIEDKLDRALDRR